MQVSPKIYSFQSLEFMPLEGYSEEIHYQSEEDKKEILERLCEKISLWYVVYFTEKGYQQMFPGRKFVCIDSQEGSFYEKPIEPEVVLNSYELNDLQIAFKKELISTINKSVIRWIMVKNYDYSVDPLGKAIRSLILDKRYPSIFTNLRFDPVRTVELTFEESKKKISLVVSRGFQT